MQIFCTSPLLSRQTRAIITRDMRGAWTPSRGTNSINYRFKDVSSTAGYVSDMNTYERCH